MINFNQIIEQYPPKLQSFQRNILREYLQHKILQIIFRSQYSNKLSFIGGTALCIVHGNQRFSEDLDFDNFNITDEEFADLSNIIQKELTSNGFEVEIRNVNKGAYRCYVRFTKILFELGLTPIEEEKILIQLDSASHNFNYAPNVIILNKFEIFEPIKVTPIDILLSQKLYAAIDRKTPKGRDFYDIVFLLSKTKPNYDYLQEKMQVSNEKELRQYFMKQIKNYDFDLLAKDVQKYLFEHQDKQRVEMFLEYFQNAKL